MVFFRLARAHERASTLRRNGSVSKNGFSSPDCTADNTPKRRANIRAKPMALVQIFPPQSIRSEQVHKHHIRVMTNLQAALARYPESLRRRRGKQVRKMLQAQLSVMKPPF